MPSVLPLPDPLNPSPVPNPPRLRPTFPEPPVTVPPVEPPPEPAPAPEPAPEPVGPIPPPEKRQPGTVPDISILGGLIVALGLAIIAAALADFFNWLVRRFMPPTIRRRIPTVSTQEITQALTTQLGAAEAGFDTELGANFHKTAGVIARVGSALVAVAQVEAQLARRLVALETGRAHDQTALANVATQTEATRHAAARVAAATQTEKHRAQHAEHANATRIQALAHHQTNVIEPELEALRHAIPELHKGLTTAFDELQKHSEALTIAGVTAATAVALDRLGGGWIRCEANQLLGRGNCEAGPENAANVLKLLLGSAVLLDLRQYVKMEQDVAKPAVEAVKLILRA